MPIFYVIGLSAEYDNNNNNKLKCNVIVEKSLFKKKKQLFHSLITEKIIPKLDNRINQQQPMERVSLAHEKLNIYILKEYAKNNLYFVCIASTDWKIRFCWKFLEDILFQFKTKKEIDIETAMKYYNDLNNDKIIRIQKEIEETKQQMISNLDKILTNQMLLNDLIEKTDDYPEESFEEMKMKEEEAQDNKTTTPVINVEKVKEESCLQRLFKIFGLTSNSSNSSEEENSKLILGLNSNVEEDDSDETTIINKKE
ncbi:hypothetical protein ABK040_015542 [Willaertia magna]